MGVDRALDRRAQARERRGVAQREGRGLRRAQALDEVEEGPDVVGVEGHHELLVVEPEGVARVEVDARVFLAHADVLLHDPPAFLRIEPVPLAGLDEGIDEEVLRVGGADLEARLVGVLRRLRHGEEGVGDRAPLHQAALGEDHVELVDALQVRGLREQHQVGVAARAHGRERPQQALGREVLAGGGELPLVGRALLVGQAAPGRVDLEERVLDDMAFGHGASERIVGLAVAERA